MRALRVERAGGEGKGGDRRREERRRERREEERRGFSRIPAACAPMPQAKQVTLSTQTSTWQKDLTSFHFSFFQMTGEQAAWVISFLATTFPSATAFFACK